MADVKITGLTSISTVDTANDPLPIVDVSDTSQASTGSTKKVTVNQIMAAGAAGTFSSATISNDLTVDTSTLKVDSTNNRVGVNKATPTTDLDVAGSVAVSGAVTAGALSPYASFRSPSGTFTAGLQSQTDSSINGLGVVGGTTTRNSIALFYDGSTSQVGIATNQTSGGFATAPGIGFYCGSSLRMGIASTIVNNQGFLLYDNDAVINGVRVGKGRGNISNNVVVGGINSTNATGQWNVGVGNSCLSSITSGSSNTSVGYNSLASLTTGTNNVAVGASAGASLSTGTQNVFIGMNTNGTGNDNVAVGISALNASSSDNNVAIGSAAAFKVTTGTLTAVGKSALFNCTTGSENTAVGYQSQLNVTTGIRNTSVGSTSGYTVTTGSDNTALGYGAGWGAASASGRIVIGKGVTATGNNRITIGIDSNIAELDLDGIDTSWAASSDERLKKNIQTLGTGLSFINALRPVSFQWRSKREVPAELADLHADSDEPVHGEADKVYHGFIAQEVKASIDSHPEVVSGQHFWELRENGIQTLAPADLVPVLVNCIKELTARVQALENP